MAEQRDSNEIDRLASAFAFTAEDLAVNRTGRLSQRQLEALQRRERRASVIVLLFTVGMAIVPAIALSAFALAGNLPMVGLSVFLLVGLPMLGYWVADSERRRWHRDRTGNVAASIYGPVWPVRAPGRMDRSRIRIENLEFAVSPEQLAAFQPGATYSIYYTPRTRMILSAERPPE